MEDFEVSDRVYAVISEAGFLTVGDLMLEMKLNPDNILALNGMGPKAMSELEKAIDALTEKLRAEEQVEEVEAEQPESQLATDVEPSVETKPAEAEETIAEAQTLEEQPAEEPVEPAAEAAELVEEPAAEQPAEEVALAEEPEAETATEGEVEPASEEPSKGEEEAPSWDELFAMSTEEIGLEDFEDEEGGDLDEKTKGKKKGKKRKKYVEMEYDPDQDVMIVKKKRKRQDEWGDDWDF